MTRPERVLTSFVVPEGERLESQAKLERATDGCGPMGRSRCVQASNRPPDQGNQSLGEDRLVKGARGSEAAAEAYRPGCSRQTLGQSQSALPHTDPLAASQVAGGTAGDYQQRGTNSRDG